MDGVSKTAALAACLAGAACWAGIPAEALPVEVAAEPPALAGPAAAWLGVAGLVAALALLGRRARSWRLAGERLAHRLAANGRTHDCLCALYEATGDVTRPLEEVLQDIVSLLPAGCAAPADIDVRIELDGATAASAGAGASANGSEFPIFVDGRVRGGFTVGRRDAAGRFDDAETALFERLAGRLSGMLRGRDARAQQSLAADIAARVVDAVKVMILIVGNDGRVRYLNAFGEALLGYPREDIVGRDWFGLALPHEADAHSRTVFEAAVAAGEPTSEFEHTVLTRGGEERRIEWRNSKLTAADGDWHWLCVGKDVTALRAAERALADEHAALEAKFTARTAQLERTTAELQQLNAEQQAILETMPAGVSVSKDRRVLRCNRAMEEILGYGPGELDGKTTRAWYLDEATFLEVQEHFLAANARQENWRYECELLRKDGSRFRGRYFGRFIDPKRPELGEVVLLDDISAEYAARLALEEARTAAEAAARAKSEFLANMSHELRTPLNALVGFTGLLLRQAPPEGRERTWLEKMETAGLYLSRLVNDILDYSRVEAGRLQLERIDFRVGEVLRSAVGMVAEAARGKGIELVIDVEPGTPSLLTGDPTRLGQVLINLLGNAVKFSDRGTVTLRVGTLDRDAQDVGLRFEVRDEGIGLSAEEQARVFERFEQADGSLTRRHGGAGLGLTIVRELVRLMGGEVGVESVPGNGARFWFSARFGCRAAAGSPWEQSADLRGVKVLAAIANPEARAAAGRMLESMGLDVRVAASMDECRRELASGDATGHYALCYLDARLTEARDFDYCLAGLPAGQRPRLVALIDGPADRLAAAAADEVLSKPVTPSSLFNAAMNALRGATGVPVLRLPARSRAEADFAGRRVLLVEDNEANRDLMINLLARYGLWTDLAEDGVVALRRLAAERYDLVFMDLQMPVMGGLEATRILRAQQGIHQPPIVAVTAHAMPGDSERCLEAGMNDYLAKPVSPEALDERLHIWLLGRGGGAGSMPGSGFSG